MPVHSFSLPRISLVIVNSLLLIFVEFQCLRLTLSFSDCVLSLRFSTPLNIHECLRRV